ncbi:MAG: sigma-70 family RNA polymerase sigma factor, partial [bacterium]|nr:sigma-70 family RNA polymerase sigma factor [bacterium]
MKTTFASSPTFQHEIWTKLYQFIRRQRHCQAADAEDLTQDVFVYLLENDRLAKLQEMASDDVHFYFLLRKTAHRRLINHQRHSQAAKRRDWSHSVSLDARQGEIPSSEPTPAPGPGACSYLKLEAIVTESEQIVTDEFRQCGKAELIDELR